MKKTVEHPLTGEKFKISTDKKIENAETEKISPDALKQMKDIYTIRPTYINGMYITPVQQQNNYLVRITFSEFNYTINETVPVSAIILSLDDFINNYKLMTEYLNQLKEQGVVQ